MDTTQQDPARRPGAGPQRWAGAGLVVALLSLAVGLVLDGGNLRQVLQPTAALIVLGGTIGAIFIQFPVPVLLRAAGMVRRVFWGEPDRAPQLIEVLGRYAMQARRQGLLSLDAELESIADPFLRACLTHAVDGARPDELKQLAEGLMQAELDRELAVPQVFEAAGGFSPTLGILGAVVGLIQVMQRLSNIEEVGRGIAVAFVATLYGVGAANLFFLPCAGRIRMLVERRQIVRELTLEGVIAIIEKNTPRAVEKRLSCFLLETTATHAEEVVVP